MLYTTFGDKQRGLIPEITVVDGFTANGLSSAYIYRTINRLRDKYKFTVGDFDSLDSGSELCMEYSTGYNAPERFESVVVMFASTSNVISELPNVTTYIPLQMVEW